MTKSVSTNPRADFYQRITDTIIRNLEQGARPWTKPWTTTSSTAGSIRPVRHDGTPYRGINVLILWSEASDNGYTSSTWMTYRQAQSQGAQVRKGERGTTIVYAKPIHVLNEDATPDSDNTRTVPLLRAHTVFNVAQIDGLPAQYLALPTPETMAFNVSGRVERADAFVTATAAHIQHRGSQARYIPPSIVSKSHRMHSFRIRQHRLPQRDITQPCCTNWCIMPISGLCRTDVVPEDRCAVSARHVGIIGLTEQAVVVSGFGEQRNTITR
jgi:antirestriction protein ArdC